MTTLNHAALQYDNSNATLNKPNNKNDIIRTGKRKIFVNVNPTKTGMKKASITP